LDSKELKPTIQLAQPQLKNQLPSQPQLIGELQEKFKKLKIKDNVEVAGHSALLALWNLNLEFTDLH